MKLQDQICGNIFEAMANITRPEPNKEFLLNSANATLDKLEVLLCRLSIEKVLSHQENLKVMEMLEQITNLLNEKKSKL